MALFYAAFFTFGGIQMPYMPAWLAAKGLDDRELGIVLAAPMLIRVIALPLATRLIDRRFDHRSALITMAAASAAGYAAMEMTWGFLAILAAYAAIAIVQSPVLPIGDSYGLRGLGARGLAYGPVRLWGSIAFIAANMGGGIFFATLGPAPVILILAAAMSATAVAAFLLPVAPDPVAPDPVAPDPVAPDSTGSAAAAPRAAGLWRSGAFVTVVAGASLVQASHAVMYGFATLQWSAAGLDGTTIGVLWAIGVVAEVLLFAVSGRLIKRFGAVAMIAAGALGAVLRWGAMAFDPPTALLPILQCLHALSFGATHLGAMQMLSRLSARGGSATAQGDFAALQGITFAAAMGLSGGLVERFGSHAYLGMAILAGAGLAIVAVGRAESRITYGA
jgi:MFS transporter, PPP family, 3-phenylpropionic acid transporter